MQSKGSASPRLDAEVLLALALSKSRVEVYTSFDQLLGESELGKIRELLKRRAAGEPVAYIVGEKEFYSRAFCVRPGVLIPRPETECLIEVVRKLFPNQEGKYRFLDLGTGSGILAITLALLYPHSNVDAVDLSPVALATARENACRHHCEDRIRFHEVDMTETDRLGSLGRYDVIVANPPYLSSTEYETISHEVRDFEPKEALWAAEEGLYFYRILMTMAPSFLNSSNGAFIAEIGAMQRSGIEQLFEASLDRQCYLIDFFKDYAGLDRGFIIRRENNGLEGA